MCDIHITFDSIDQMIKFRKKIIRDLQCEETICHSCKDADICEIVTRLIIDLQGKIHEERYSDYAQS